MKKNFFLAKKQKMNYSQDMTCIMHLDITKQMFGQNLAKNFQEYIAFNFGRNCKKIKIAYNNKKHKDNIKNKKTEV